MLENNITEENIDPNIEKRSVQSLPVLKNGSKFKDLKYLETRNIRGDVIFSNTCAFDSITTIIMVIIYFEKNVCDNFYIVLFYHECKT